MSTQLSTDPARLSVQVIPGIPRFQSQLLLYEPKQHYHVEQNREIPEIFSGEFLVQVQAIGLNPIDWKSATYGFALPAFPCVNGREFVGKIIHIRDWQRSNFEIGDTVLSICTDYRDFRKSAFQEYAVVSTFNAVKIPLGFNSSSAASVGVAFVAAALGLGVCFGLRIPRGCNGEKIDLLEIVRAQKKEEMSEDVVREVFDAIDPWNRPHTGDWILIYGASSITAQVAIQIAKWSGLKIIAVADLNKHGDRLRALGVDRLIDRHDLEKAAREIRKDTPVPIRFALDTVGPETALWCQNVLASRTGVQYRPSLLQTGLNNNAGTATVAALPHLLCLTGAPKLRNPNVRIHTVPIKLFHTSHEIGRNVAEWLSALLCSGKLKLPQTIYEDGNLDTVRHGLDRIKSGELSGKRLVVRLRDRL